MDPRRVKSSCGMATPFEEIGSGSGKWWKPEPSSDTDLKTWMPSRWDVPLCAVSTTLSLVSFMFGVKLARRVSSMNTSGFGCRHLDEPVAAVWTHEAEEVAEENRT